MTRKSPDIVADSMAHETAALFAGTFNPFTIGHADIVRRGLDIFDRVVICLGVNMDKPDASTDASLDKIRRLYESEPRVTVTRWSGLTIDAAKHFGCNVLLRGVRSAKDFEYERDLADINRHLSGIDTVLLFAAPEHSYVSSSMVRELIRHGVDVAPYLPSPE